MNQFLSTTFAELLGRKRQFLVPADPAELTDTFLGKRRPENEENEENVCLRPEALPEYRRDQQVLVALIRFGSMNMGELARAMGCSGGEATRRVALAGKKVRRRKSGRNVFVSLA